MVSVIAGVNLSFLFLNAGNGAADKAQDWWLRKDPKKAICFLLKAFLHY